LGTVIKICKLVDENGALLICAPPGSGKTSILQLVAYVNTRKKGIFKQAYYINLAQIGK
jgi:replicative superfamily II helicase